MSNIKQILEEKVAEFNSRIKDEPKYSAVIEGKREASVFQSQMVTIMFQT